MLYDVRVGTLTFAYPTPKQAFEKRNLPFPKWDSRRPAITFRGRSLSTQITYKNYS